MNQYKRIIYTYSYYVKMYPIYMRCIAVRICGSPKQKCKPCIVSWRMDSCTHVDFPGCCFGVCNFWTQHRQVNSHDWKLIKKTKVTPVEFHWSRKKQREIKYTQSLNSNLSLKQKINIIIWVFLPWRWTNGSNPIQDVLLKFFEKWFTIG